MKVPEFIAQLEGVRHLGPDRWIARCPAHSDRCASLSVRAIADRTLIHCFAGCGTDDVVRALGLKMIDLFERPAAEHCKSEQRPFDAVQVLHALAHEVAAIGLMADVFASGEPLSEVAQERLIVAGHRIHRALDLIGEPPVPEELRTLRRGKVA